eukprot:COSAG06_NODE_1099_length_10711_cov_145.571711_6_plen_46_part_00
MSQMKMYHAARGHCNVKKRELKVSLSPVCHVDFKHSIMHYHSVLC